MPKILPRGSTAAIADVYEDLRDDVLTCAGAHARATHQPLDDVLGAANLYFLEAYHTFDPRRGTLRRWVIFRVHYRLREEAREYARRQARHPRAALPAAQAAPDPATFDVDALRAAVGPDARVVLALLLDGPAVTPPLSAPAQIRAVRRALAAAGWPPARTQAALDDVENRLAESEGALP